MKKVKRMVTPREFAKMHGVAYTTVMNWLQNDLLKGAHKEPLAPPFVGYIYKIPEDVSPPKLKPGPKPMAKKRATKKKEFVE